MLQAVLSYPRASVVNAHNGKRDDGLALAAFWLASNGTVGLDYEGRLFLSLWRMRRGAVLEGADGAIRPAWDPQRAACFVHDNGAAIEGLGYNLMGVGTKPLRMRAALPRAWHPNMTATAVAPTTPAPPVHSATSAPAPAAVVTSLSNITTDLQTTWSSLAAARQPAVASETAPTKAGLIVVHLGAAWPAYVRFAALSAAPHATAVTFYFLGPPPTPLEAAACPLCRWLPLSAADLDARLTQYLGLKTGSVPLGLSDGRKLCDTKPMWLALFPELTARHEWIGYADSDIVWGNLTAEVSALRADDELLTPSNYFPHLLSNGNLLLMRSTPKMVNAFRRSPAWRRALQQPTIYVFDEQFGSDGPSMVDVFRDMWVAGELEARPTRRLLVQDMLYLGRRSKGLYPSIASFGAKVDFEWRRGALLAERLGPCACSRQLWDVTLSTCAECRQRPGEVLSGTRMHVRTHVLGVHLQVWKKQWGRAAFAARDKCASAFRIDLPRGFACG